MNKRFFNINPSVIGQEKQSAFSFSTTGQFLASSNVEGDRKQLKSH